MFPRPGPSIDFGRPVPLFDGLDVAGGQTPFSVAPDGRFLMVEVAPGSATHIGQVTLALNWAEELTRRVPARWRGGFELGWQMGHHGDGGNAPDDFWLQVTREAIVV